MNPALENLRNEIEACQKCSLYQGRNHTIFGNGNENASIMLVGEAPGADEDRIGTAFIGKAGQLLDKIMLACNFTREKHVFISNIIKCRPPGNRVPENSEIVACLPYLDQQIELINPNIIVAMGATAYRSLVGGSPKITRDRGKWQMLGNRFLMPTYHPSALLRNPNLKKDAWEDFKEVIRKYRMVVDPDHECKYL